MLIFIILVIELFEFYTMTKSLEIALNEYCKEIRKNLDILKLYPEEIFSEYLDCVYMSTNLDSQGENLPFEFLEEFVKNVKNKQFYILVEHDITHPPVGRVLDCKIYFDTETKEHYIIGVTGLFNQNKLLTLNSVDIDKHRNLQFAKLSTIQPSFNVVLGLNSLALNKEDYYGLIDTLPSFVPREIEDMLQKGAEIPTNIELYTSIFLLLANPFSKKLLEVYGESAANKIKEYYSYLKKYFFVQLLNKDYNKVIATIESGYNNCEVYFSIIPKENDKINIAVETINQAAESACKMIDNLQYLSPIKLCFLFNDATSQWQPEYIVTKKVGVIVDKPQVIALEKYQGLSISGSRGRIVFK